MLRKGMFLADRYEILEQIGTGGMSDVYKAKCHKLNRFVAIKVLKREFSDDRNFVSKFVIEAQSAAGLIHPNIVNVYDVGEEQGVHYIVMELVEGITLKKYIEKKGRLTSKEAVSIAIQVAQGIEAAHSHHIIHRDIKPQNIIISKEGKVKVTDFGIARAATSSTINSSAMGSVHYISPEQARGGYSDEKSDIYSFGITLFEMLTGTVPFDGDTTVAVAVRHIQDSIPLPSTIADDIPISVDKIVEKCTQKKTDRRYQSATELIVDLKKSLVMPDVDFVKIGSAFEKNSVSEDTQFINLESISDRELDIEDIEEDEYDEQDDFVDDDFLEEKKPTPKPVKKAPKKRPEEDIEDIGNEKLDKIMKWIGIAIAGVILIITVVVVIMLAGAVGSVTGNNNGTEATVSSTQSATINSSNQVTVPSVVGKTEEEAGKALNDIGLGYKVVKDNSDTVEEGKVISQSQKEGTVVAKNSTITLTISEGVNSFDIENVVGKTEADASKILKDAELTVTIDYQYSSSTAQGNVISQTPKSGSSVKSGDEVTIVVSRGQESSSVSVPNLIGRTESEARHTLEALGLKASFSTNRVSSASVPAGSVVSQSYSSGSRVNSGTTVELVLSSGSGSTSNNTSSDQAVVPIVVGLNETQAKETLESVGLVASVSYTSSETVRQGLVSIQGTPGGTVVNKGTSIAIIVSTGSAN